MNYFLYKLKFSTPVHFGGSDSAQSLSGSGQGFCADTLFSALCQTALHCGGEQELNTLYTAAVDGALRLSDALPWKADSFYLPRPCIEPTVRREFSSSERKEMKKVEYIPVEHFADYLKGLTDADSAVEIDPSKLRVSFGQVYSVTKAAVPDRDDAVPYNVGLYQFADDAGLYIIAGMQDEQWAQTLKRYLTILGDTGVGGKVSAGYGKFTVEEMRGAGEIKELSAMLKADNCTSFMSISASLPKDGELDAAMDGAAYRLVRRSGYIQSAAFGAPLKKLAQYFFTAGSVFQNKFEGDVYNVAPSGPHAVYRYGIPMFLGVQ